MELKTIIHAPDEAKEVVERLVGENLENKIGSYLKKFDKKDAEGNLEITVKKSEKGYEAKLHINIDGEKFIYERDEYKNLDDLVNHLFNHFKEDLSSK